MCLVRVHQTSIRTDIQILLISTPTTLVRRRCHTNNYIRSGGHGLQEKNTKKCSAPLNAECFDSSYKRKGNTKSRRKLEEETLATTKSAKETQEEISTNDECDQDSNISFNDGEESTTSHEDNLEEVIEYGKRSTREADEKC